MLISLVGIFSILIIGYLFYKSSGLSMHLNFALSANEKLNMAINELNIEKIEYIKKIQDLTNQVEYLRKLTTDQESSRKEAFDAAKASLFDLGSSLSKQLIEIHKEENKESRQLSEKNIAATSENFQKEFQKILMMVSSLSKDVVESKTTVDIIQKSLLSPTGAGKLAEITLENILKSSGLKSGMDFSMQHHLSNEDGRQRPDSVIFLPSNNLMVIDAKASKFLVEIPSSNNQEEKIALEKQLMKTMHAHLKSIVSKEYAENTISHYKLKDRHFNNVITLMFLPTESALERITNIDEGFIHKAWAHSIFPVGPTGLMNMLSFAKFQINDHMRSENHKLIIDEVRKLLVSISSITEHSQKLGSGIKNLVANYDKFSASFNRNFLPKAKNIRSLGIDIGKQDLKSLERYHMVSANSDLIEVENSKTIEIEEEKE